MSQPIAVIAGDIHYSLASLSVADAATRMAIAKANQLNVPFIANGDTHCTKANLRGECVNAMIETFKTCAMTPYVNVGNHCKIHEKSREHSLNFLKAYAHVIDSPRYVSELNSYIVPYHHDVDTLRAYLKTLPKESRLIMHQGLSTGNPGEYIRDHSALSTSDLADFRTILSHYHARQDIKCGRPRRGAAGLASYIGSPYTTTFAEANDPEKGFQVLYSDGTLEFVPTNLRRHIVVEKRVEELNEIEHITIHHVDDIIQVKVSGTPEQLAVLTKDKVAKALGISNSFRLDLIPTENETKAVSQAKNQSQPELLDHLIDIISNASIEQKDRLKNLWKGL